MPCSPVSVPALSKNIHGPWASQARNEEEGGQRLKTWPQKIWDNNGMQKMEEPDLKKNDNK